jgi:hypothetical protein
MTEARNKLGAISERVSVQINTAKENDKQVLLYTILVCLMI